MLHSAEITDENGKKYNPLSITEAFKRIAKLKNFPKIDKVFPEPPKAELLLFSLRGSKSLATLVKKILTCNNWNDIWNMYELKSEEEEMRLKFYANPEMSCDYLYEQLQKSPAYYYNLMKKLFLTDFEPEIADTLGVRARDFLLFEGMSSFAMSIRSDFPIFDNWARPMLSEIRHVNFPRISLALQYLFLCGDVENYERFLKIADDIHDPKDRSDTIQLLFFKSLRQLLSSDYDGDPSLFSEYLKLPLRDLRSEQIFNSYNAIKHIPLLFLAGSGIDSQIDKIFEIMPKREKDYTCQCIELFTAYSSSHSEKIQIEKMLNSFIYLRIEYFRPIEAVYYALLFKWKNALSNDLISRFKNTEKTLRDLGYIYPADQLAKIMSLSSSVVSNRRVFPLVDLKKESAKWEIFLKNLDNLVETSKPKKQSKVRATAEKRIAWIFSHTVKKNSFDNVDLVPALQVRKGDDWVFQKEVSMKEAMTDSDIRSLMTMQDNEILSAVETVKAGRGVRYLFEVVDAIPFLADHPGVLDSKTYLPVRFRKGVVVFQLEETGGGYKFANNLSCFVKGPAYYLEREAPNSFVIYCNEPTEMRIFTYLLENSILIPRSGKEALEKTLISLGKRFAVSSPFGHQIAKIQKDSKTEPHLYLYPVPPAGLMAELRIEPIPNAPLLLPGEGPEKLILQIDGESVEVVRSLKAENANADKICEAIPFLGTKKEGYSTTIQDGFIAWELLDALKENEHLVDVKWPRGKSIEMIKKVKMSDFSMLVENKIDYFQVTPTVPIDTKRMLSFAQLIDMAEKQRGGFISFSDKEIVRLEKKVLDFIRICGYYNIEGKDYCQIPLAAAGLFEEYDDVGKWKLPPLPELPDDVTSIPTTFQAELRDYQTEGVNWLCRLSGWGLGGILADDMGLGKTVQTIALLAKRGEGGSALIIAPVSVCQNWVDEIIRFCPALTPILYVGNNRKSLLNESGPNTLFIVSYALLQNDVEIFQTYNWNTIIVDEAQAIKNYNSKRTTAVLSLKGKFRLALSGTPVENYLVDMWTLFQFTNPGLLGSRLKFLSKFSSAFEKGGSSEKREALQKIITPFFLRRKKGDVLSELPPKTELIRKVELSSEERSFYEAQRLHSLAKISETTNEKGFIAIFAELMKLRRASLSPSLVEKSAPVVSSKIELLLEITEELNENRHKALIFSQFVDYLQIIKSELEKRNLKFSYLDGSTPRDKRTSEVSDFQSGKTDFFLISLKAGGTGLNLTAADYVIHMDPWWNPAVEEQASDRAHRMGQTRPVTIYKIIAIDTIEERILELHGRKKEVAEALFGDGDKATSLSPQELRDLISGKG